ncbi:MAG TPA: hypothetical protein VMX17_01750 [Candidatus Glassbacteria bacterium]|nr:hypothetical protein [Candidatus Glassbacteria bacterium]
MSERIGNTFVIQEEAAQQCDLCGKIAELRPYGPKGECICFECGMKDEDGTVKRFLEVAGLNNPPKETDENAGENPATNQGQK